MIAEYKGTSTERGAVVYLTPIVVNSEDNTSCSADVVGLLGNQTAQDALSCLKKAPLLEDLSEWSHWEIVFQPQLGNLSTFLTKISRLDGDNMLALEISPGKLLKIDQNSSIKNFIVAVENLDAINASGHLVSVIVQRGNTNDISAQLLANHMLSSLEKQIVKSKTEGEQEVSLFIYKCLIRIPLQICKFIANEVGVWHTGSSITIVYAILIGFS